MANELHDNVKFGKQQTINFHENWQHQIDGSQQYLKGHTHTHTYGQWADGKQTNPVEDKDNKKKETEAATGASRVRKDYDRIYYTTGANNNKSRKSGKQNRTSHNLSDMSAQSGKKWKKKKCPLHRKNIYLFIYIFINSDNTILSKFIAFINVWNACIYFFFFFWPRTLGSRETLRVISSVQLRNFPKRSESQTSVLYETHALNVWLLVLPATRMQITVGQLNRKPKSSSRAKLLLVSFRLICYLQHFACQI